MFESNNVKKCKVSFKNSDGKIIMSQRGYCDANNPDKIVNRDIEMDLEGLSESMQKTMRKIEYENS